MVLFFLRRKHLKHCFGLSMVWIFNNHITKEIDGEAVREIQSTAYGEREGGRSMKSRHFKISIDAGEILSSFLKFLIPSSSMTNYTDTSG